MRIFSIESYENLIPKINLTYKDIECSIKGKILNFPQIRNYTVEWKMALPMFVPAFYDFVEKMHSIPTQEQFFIHYYELNSKWFEASHLNNEIINGLKARVFRTYPSLVRDLHFSKLCVEKLFPSSVIYNQLLDIKEGIDIMIVHNGDFYAINLFTQTNRAFLGREKKAYRHDSFHNVNYIELPVNFNGSYKCGSFYLYGQREIEIIKKNLNI